MSARPRARACTRFVDGPSSTYARDTFSVSRSSSKLFSALATADFQTFPTARAARDGAKRSSASASFTGRPRIIRTTNCTFLGESLRYLASALASIQGLPSRSRRRRRCRRRRRGGGRHAGRPLRCSRGGRGRAGGTVPLKDTGRWELAEFVAHHLFRYVDGHVLRA